MVKVERPAGDSFVASGQLRALAAQSGRRLPKYPALPLISETYPAYTTSGFLGIAVPAATPRATLQALNDLINEAITTDPLKARLEGFGFMPQRMSLTQLATFDREERARWKSYVAIARIVPQ